jgi:hypothetical protein
MYDRHKRAKHQTKHFYKVTQNYNPKKCKKTSQGTRQCMSNETMWPVRVTIVAPKAAMLFLSTVLDLHEFVNNTKSLSFAMETQEGVPFVLLSSYKVFVNNTDRPTRTSCFM